MKANIILHHSKTAEYENTSFLSTLSSVFGQTNQNFEVTIIIDKETADISKHIEELNINSIKEFWLLFHASRLLHLARYGHHRP